jgi:hypothetical protein
VTPKGNESFELPKLSDQVEGLDIRRRDRYSALLLAAYAARTKLGTGFQKKIPTNTGGLAEHINRRGKGQIRRIGGVIF